jgi:hypothetical protein
VSDLEAQRDLVELERIGAQDPIDGMDSGRLVISGLHFMLYSVSFQFLTATPPLRLVSAAERKIVPVISGSRGTLLPFTFSRNNSLNLHLCQGGGSRWRMG